MVDLPYSRDILRLAAESGLTGRLDDRTVSAARDSLTCGAHATVDLALAPDGRIAGYGHLIRACAIGQASSALLARVAVGLDEGSVRAGRDALAARLGGDDAGLPADWQALAAMDSVRPIRQRHEAALLVFDAVLDALAGARQPPDADGSNP